MKDDHSVFTIHERAIVESRDIAVNFVRPPATFYVIWGKRLFDIVFSAVALIVLSPFIAIVWCIVSLNGGNGFYGQVRIGKGRRSFSCWKLRSMVVDADTRLQAYLESNPKAAQEWAASRKLAKDPRITRFGNFIRKTSIDELPQLWNVLLGDMSIVGPRPVVAEELVMYGPVQAAYVSMRPGITGMWQVNGRNSVSYEARIAFDQRYCATVSFLGDLKLILKTILVVVNKTGQ